MEIGNAFSEQNDPADAGAPFEPADGRARAAGDDEAQLLDEDYLRALEYGMPPTGGARHRHRPAGRCCVTDTRSIRDVILFPQLRPEEGRAALGDEAEATPAPTADARDGAARR